MKKLVLGCLLVASLFVVGCKAKPAADAAADPAAAAADAEPAAPPSKKDGSYAFGMAVGTSILGTGVKIDYASFAAGVKAVMEAQKTRFTMDDANAKIQAMIAAVSAEQTKQLQEKETAFFAENGKKEGVVTTESGLQYQVVTAGAGAKPADTDEVRVHYVGTFMDGSPFDSSVERGEPVVFPVNQVIPGWAEGVKLMPVGSKYKLFIPSALAYGETGVEGYIQPYSPLIFEVQLLEIVPAGTAEKEAAAAAAEAQTIQ
jgi:FKBP-type peptidyl-prolyl cis-trans isomerase